MKTVAKYLKPFALLICTAIVLLFMQAIFDLKLPDYMSDIVNVGIQQGGINDIAPSAISEDRMEFLSLFMTEDDLETVNNAYTLRTPSTATAEELEQYPLLKNKSIYLLNEGIDDLSSLNTIFENASYSFLSLAQTYAPDDLQQTNGETSSINVTALYPLTEKIAALPSSVIENAQADAYETAANTKKSVAVAFTKSFYEELGIDVSSMQVSYILQVGGKMLFMSALSVLASICVGYCASKVGTGFARSLRSALFNKVESFSNQEFDIFSTSSLITRTTNDVTQMQQVVTMGIRMLASAPIMGIGGAIMAWRKSPSMAWLIALAIIIILGLIAVLYVVAMPKFKIMQQLIDRLNLVVRENLSGMLVIRAFSTQKFEEEKFNDANKNLASTNLFVTRTMGLMMPVMNLVMNGLTILIVWIGAKQIAASSMQVGDMMAFMQYATQIIMNFFMISMMFIMIPRASVSATRIAEVLNTEPTIVDPASPVAISNNFDATIEFKDVSFRYPGADENAIENISFLAKPGQTTAFIGSTGSGKTTLINLIPRFYDTTNGEVVIGGHNVKDYTQHDLRETIGLVPQKANLFTGTVDSNIRYGNQEASEDEIMKAANTAQATEFVEKLPEKFETPIAQGGTNVSGGQRQRLSIARALATNAPIYVFDDSFSALDFKTDSALRRALHDEAGDATIIIVAQRINTIMQAEQIIVLDEGRIVGKGTHQELLKTCETYREIALSQLSEEELA